MSPGRALLGCAALGLVLAASACGNEVPTTFSGINAQIFSRSCTFACHSGGEFAAGGLDLEGDAYHALVRKPAVAAACLDAGFERVTPGDPDASLLIQKIEAKVDGTHPPCGAEMPSGLRRAALDPDEAEAIRIWVQKGAPND